MQALAAAMQGCSQGGRRRPPARAGAPGCGAALPHSASPRAAAGWPCGGAGRRAGTRHECVARAAPSGALETGQAAPHQAAPAAGITTPRPRRSSPQLGRPSQRSQVHAAGVPPRLPPSPPPHSLEGLRCRPPVLDLLSRPHRQRLLQQVRPLLQPRHREEAGRANEAWPARAPSAAGRRAGT